MSAFHIFRPALIRKLPVCQSWIFTGRLSPTLLPLFLYSYPSRTFEPSTDGLLLQLSWRSPADRLAALPTNRDGRIEGAAEVSGDHGDEVHHGAVIVSVLS